MLDRENIIREQEELKLLNQQLQTQVVTLQNNSTQTNDEPESNRSLSIRALDELIQNWIVETQAASAPDPNYLHPLLSSLQRYPGV